jgi:hypothetical protein
MREKLWRFDPWNPGPARFKGQRVLLVAESHYDADPDSLESQHTAEVVKWYGVGDEPCKTPLFRNTYSAFTGDFDRSVSGGKAVFWNSVLYCNYFQRPMSVSNETPTDADFDQAQAAFDAVLHALEPDCFVVMSNRLWLGMKNACKRISFVGPLNGDDAFDFSVGDRVIPAIHINHPSSPSFDAGHWHSRINEFLDFVKSRPASR